MAKLRGYGEDGAARLTENGDLNAAVGTLRAHGIRFGASVSDSRGMGATRGIWLGMGVTDRDFHIVDGVTGQRVART